MTALGPLGTRLERKLNAAFSPQELVVEDDSAKHAGHSGARAGGESHFNVRIVSQAFAGLSRVERQRRIYALLAEEFAAGLHALSLNALTPEDVTRSSPMR